MADEQIQSLARLSAAGDLDARKSYYAELIRTCEHKGEQFLSMREQSLWGHGEMWCSDCGVCLSNPSLEPRPENAAENRRLTESAKKFEERMAKMTPAEKAQWKKELVEGIEARLNGEKMRKMLRPFRQGRTRRG